MLIWSCKSINRFWRCVYGNGLWLNRLQAESLVKDGWAFTVSRLLLARFLIKIFLRSTPEVSHMFKPQKFWHAKISFKDGYSTLASLCCKQGIHAYHLRPKLHMFCHLVFLNWTFSTWFFCCGLAKFCFWGRKKNWLTMLTGKPLRRRLDLQHMLERPTCAWVLNISIHATWADEDFIGRVSRVSRRCHVATTAWNTIQRALGFYRRHWGSEFSKSYLNQT